MYCLTGKTQHFQRRESGMSKINPEVGMRVVWENEGALSAPFAVLVSLCKRLHGEDELVVKGMVETARGWLVNLTKNGQLIYDRNGTSVTSFDWYLLRPL